MKILLLGDEDFNHKVLKGLADASYDVTSIRDLGLDRQWFSDEDVLKTAIELGRIVLTHNKRDFIRLHRKTNQHPGIITCYQTSDHDTLTGKILQLLEEVDSFENNLFRIYKQ